MSTVSRNEDVVFEMALKVANHGPCIINRLIAILKNNVNIAQSFRGGPMGVQLSVPAPSKKRHTLLQEIVVLVLNNRKKLSFL